MRGASQEGAHHCSVTLRRHGSIWMLVLLVLLLLPVQSRRLDIGVSARLLQVPVISTAPGAMKA